jgi:hypothetical protein
MFHLKKSLKPNNELDFIGDFWKAASGFEESPHVIEATKRSLCIIVYKHIEEDFETGIPFCKLQ